MNSKEVSQNFRTTNPGPLDSWRGPYATVEAACLAIENRVDEDENGKLVNFRKGKEVDIAFDSDHPLVTYWWPGPGYSDSGLVEKVDLSSVATKKEVTDATNYETILERSTGVPIPASGVSTGINRTRIDNTAIQSELSIRPVNLLLRIAAAGTLKFMFCTQNGSGNFSPVAGSQITKSVVIGETNITEADFDGFILPPGTYYPAFYVSDGASISGVDTVSDQRGWYILSELTNPNTAPSGTSTLQLQFKFDYEEYSALSVKDKVTDLEGQLSYTDIESAFSGVPAPVSTASTNTGRTRVHATPIVEGVKTIVPKELQIQMAAAGTLKFMFCTRSGISPNYSYAMVPGKFITKAVASGNITLTEEDFDGLSLPPGTYYPAFYLSGGASISGSNVVASNASYLVLSDVGTAPVSATVSDLNLQFKLTYSLEKVSTVKDEIGTLRKYISNVDSALGSDETGDGSFSNPYKTITKAIFQCVGKAFYRIVVRGIDSSKSILREYRETLDFQPYQTNENIEIVAYGTESVQVMGSDKLTSITKTGGYTNIYQAPFSGNIPAWTRANDPIFELGNWTEAIDFDRRYPHQRGQEYYLPFKPLLYVQAGANLAATLANLDVVGGYYHDKPNGVLYFVPTGNPATNGFTYEVPQRPFNTYPTLSDKQRRGTLTMKNLKFFCGSAGFESCGWESVSRYYCALYGAAAGPVAAGGWMDNTSNGLAEWDIAFYVDGDTCNGHYNKYGDWATQDLTSGHPNWTYIMPWYGYAMDDSMSHHERHNVLVISPLFEKSNDRGVASAQGCQCTMVNPIIHGHGRNAIKDGVTIVPNSGAGLAAVNNALDGTNGTKLLVFGGSIENNAWGCEASTDGAGIVENVVELHDTAFRNNVTYVLRAAKALIKAYNCKVTNTTGATVKSEVSGGVITIVNDSQLV